MPHPPCTSFFGHDFQPRYDTIAPTPEQISATASVPDVCSSWYENVLNRLITTKYVQDVCINCGAVTSRGFSE